jgi:hypothetical protein
MSDETCRRVNAALMWLTVALFALLIWLRPSLVLGPVALLPIVAWAFWMNSRLFGKLSAAAIKGEQIER